jgi:hypothetical protein
LHHNNAQPHISFRTREIFTKNRLFYTIEVIDAESQEVLNTFTEHDTQDAFKKWQKR